MSWSLLGLAVVANSGLFSGETSSDIAIEKTNTYHGHCWAWKLSLPQGCSLGNFQSHCYREDKHLPWSLLGLEVVATSGFFSGETSSDIAVQETITYLCHCWAWMLWLFQGYSPGKLLVILLYRRQTLTMVIAGLGSCGYLRAIFWENF